MTPRLNSNGILLSDDKLLARLQEAGLEWIILQFDGFNADNSRRFRGADLIAHKLKLVDKLGRRGFKLHFAVMLERRSNLEEIHEILNYAAQKPHVLRVSFYPRSLVGRTEEQDRSTNLADVMDALDRGSGGVARREDFFAQRRLWNFLFRLTRHPLFRTRVCITPIVLVRTRDSYVPLNRLLRPSIYLKHPELIARLARLPFLMGFDRGRFGRDFLLVNVEKFYDTHTFLHHEALNCHHVYLTEQGYVPFCWHNSLTRLAAG
ncbi:MAG: hypothetical protein M5R36_14765 [Deltaproteobacteria bacterium]|nr:hypothetical protein [Deltaproteobacteria bacterium]